MSDHEQYPGNDQGNVTRDQIPHSGRRGYESPVNDFDNTTLADAHKQGLLVTPEHPGALTGNDKKGNIKKRIGLALAGIGLVGTGGFVAKTTMGGEPAPTPEREPSVSAPVVPGEGAAEETTVDYEPSELTVEEYSDGDSLIRALHEEYNKWMTAGVNLEGDVDWANPESSIRSISEQYDEKYTDTLLIEDWESNPALAEVISSFEDQHAIVLNASIMTTDSNQPEDIEPYTQGYEVTETQVLDESPDEMTVSSSFTMWSNADKNRGDSYIENVNGRTGGQVVTFVNQNGVWKISEILPLAQ